MNNGLSSVCVLRRPLQIMGLLALLAAPFDSAQAQDLNARIKRVENEIETLSRAVYRGEAPPPGSLAVGEGVSASGAANVEVRLQQIELDLRNLTGTLEQRSFDDQQAQARVDQTIAALEARVAGLEARLGSATATMPAAPLTGGGVSAGLADLSGAPQVAATSGAPPQPTLTGTDAAAGAGFDAAIVDNSLPATGSGGQLGVLRAPQGDAAPAYQPPPASGDDPVGLYEQAFTFLKDQNFAQAQVGFEDFLTRYPAHDLAANAKYWLGESFYVRGDFERAAREFAEAYQKYATGPKGADNLLKLGMSLSGMGKKDEACLTFAQLKKEYPAGATPVLMRGEQEAAKLGCLP